MICKFFVNQAVQNSITHRYKLQPQKSVVIEVNKKGRNPIGSKPDMMYIAGSAALVSV
jgi:hypothetical protein